MMYLEEAEIRRTWYIQTPGHRRKLRYHRKSHRETVIRNRYPLSPTGTGPEIVLSRSPSASEADTIPPDLRRKLLAYDRLCLNLSSRSLPVPSVAQQMCVSRKEDLDMNFEEAGWAHYAPDTVPEYVTSSPRL